MPPPLQVDIQVAADQSAVPADAEIRRWLEQTVAAAGNEAERQVEISVRIVDEAESRALNRQYRSRDNATNVLSFPLSDEGLRNPPADLPLSLGDIVICAPVVAREASEQGKKDSDHWAHLLVHGALHLMGYDHETEDQAREMESLETRILAFGGVENPYKTRD